MVLSHRVALAWLLVSCKDPDKANPTGEDPREVPRADAIAPEALFALVGEPVTLDGSASVGQSFHWTTSDGQSLEGATAELLFDTPGHYTAILEAIDEAGRSDTDSVSVTITWPTSAEIPAASSSLASDGDLLWAVLTDLDVLVAVDVQGLAVDRAVETCRGPRSVAVGHGARWVACPGADTVLRITDTQTEEIATPWGSQPFGIVAVPDGVYVTLQGTGEVAVLTPEGVLSRTVPALPDARGIAVQGSTTLVSRWRSPDAGGQVAVLDEALAVVGNTVLPIDEGPDSDTNARGLPNLLGHITVRPDGRVAAVSGLKSNIERGLFREGVPLTFETASRADLRLVSLHEGEGPVFTQTAAALFDDRDQAIASAWSPLGDWLYVLFPGMETVEVRDGYTLAVSGAIQGVGSGADGLWVSLDGGTLWVLAQGSRTLTAYDMLTPAVPTPLATLDLVPPSGERLDPTVLAGKILFGRSVDPRMSTGGYLSCASCHPDGDHDGRTWDFTDRGEGLRNTISLLGGGGSAPIHWSANFDEIADFENDIRYGQGGTGFLDEETFAATSDPLGAPKAGLSPELDALAAYVQSLTTPTRSPYRAPDGGPTAEAILGEALFLDPAVGCADCHPPPTYTDSAWLSPGEPLLHDVGTLSAGSGMRRGEALLGLDTPSLLGLSASGPYLHDGSALTVRDVLVSRNAADQHGVTSTLGEAEIGALEAFLLGL